MSSEPTIELVDIYKSFGSTRVLEEVSLPLFPGEVHSLMGENGAGKSTLVKIMAGLYLSHKGARRFVNDWNAHGPAHHSAIGIGHLTGKLNKLAALLQIEITEVC
jgi:ABC-type sugar transport system ATPase subunit